MVFDSVYSTGFISASTSSFSVNLPVESISALHSLIVLLSNTILAPMMSSISTSSIPSLYRSWRAGFTFMVYSMTSLSCFPSLWMTSLLMGLLHVTCVFPEYSLLIIEAVFGMFIVLSVFSKIAPSLTLASKTISIFSDMEPKVNVSVLESVSYVVPAADDEPATYSRFSFSLSVTTTPFIAISFWLTVIVYFIL